MNRLTAIFLCCALLLQCLARFSVMGLYALRKDFVAKNLCENRGRPELRCCGKCVLRKQLAKADEHSGASGNTPKKTEQPESAALLAPQAMPLYSGGCESLNRPFNPRRQRMFHSAIPGDIFRPPLV